MPLDGLFAGDNECLASFLASFCYFPDAGFRRPLSRSDMACNGLVKPNPRLIAICEFYPGCFEGTTGSRQALRAAAGLFALLVGAHGNNSDPLA